MRNIDTDLLRTFVAIIDQGGFIKAGDALGRSQSAISMQMKRLEEICNCALFERAGRKMKMTPNGEKLLGYARRLVVLHDQALDAMAESQLSGVARLAVMGDYATRVLPEILARFVEQYPKIQMEVTTGFTRDLITQLGHQFDLVLATQPLNTGRGEILRREKTHWAFSANHDLPKDDILPLALLLPGNMFREWALRALDDAGIRWRILYTSSSIAAVEAVAEAGIALTVVKQGTARPGLRILDERFGMPPLPESEIALHKAPGKLPPAAKMLAEHLQVSLAESA